MKTWRYFYRRQAAALFAAATIACAAEPAAPPLYDKDPRHLWNRLYAALMMPEEEGKALPPDLLDPPITAIELLQRERGQSAAMALLREFVKSGPRPETMSPLQRAVMQRDLLAVFHLIAFRQPGEAWTAPQRELLAPLAQAIRHVALTAEEIKKLPDNYAAAAGAPEAVTAYDRGKLGAFLPKDLLASDGPWIVLGAKQGTSTGGGSVAHFHFEKFAGRASFEVRMRHPGGRAAGEAYLKSLAEMKDPRVLEKPENVERLLPNGVGPGPWPNPDTPQFPAGTMWALVRRPLLVDRNGKMTVAPLVESVQVRVYNSVTGEDTRKTPEYQAELDALRDQNRQIDFDDLLLKHYQTAFEWEMQRSLLLGKGGFHLTTAEDLQYSHFAPVEGKGPVTRFCIQCHVAPGIHSVHSRAGLFRSEPLLRFPEFEPASRESLDRLTLHYAGKFPAWALLDWLWADKAGP